MSQLRLGILGSTRGTDLLALITAIQKKILSATIAVVISDKKNSGILEKARDFGLMDAFVNPVGLARQAFDAEVTKILHAEQVDLVVLIGFMRILSDDFVATWRHKIINVHPSLLPQFAGGMDQDVHRAVLNSGVKETGCTVHYVDEHLDAGPIILQKKCPVFPDDTVETLKARVQKLEGEALIEVIRGALRENL